MANYNIRWVNLIQFLLITTTLIYESSGIGIVVIESPGFDQKLLEQEIKNTYNNKVNASNVDIKTKSIIGKTTWLDKRNLAPTNFRPLTRIGSTGLFFNLPYKIHVVGKPKCFLTFWTIEDEGVPRLTCKPSDQDYYDHQDSDWVLEPVGRPEDPYTGVVTLRNMGSKGSRLCDTFLPSKGEDLDHESEMGLHAMRLCGDAPSTDYKTQFTLVPSVLDGSIAIVQQINGGGNHRFSLGFEEEEEEEEDSNQRYTMGKVSGYRFIFQFVHFGSELTADLKRFEFDPLSQDYLNGFSEIENLFDSYSIDNQDSDQPLTREVKVSKNVTDEFSWGFGRGFNQFQKVKLSPLIPYAQTSNYPIEFSNSPKDHQWRTFVDKEFDLVHSVTVPPRGKVQVSGTYTQLLNVSLPYRADAEISGKLRRMTPDDVVVLHQVAPGEYLQESILNNHFEGTLLHLLPEQVIFKIRGILHAYAGINGELKVDNNVITVPTHLALPFLKL